MTKLVIRVATIVFINILFIKTYAVTDGQKPGATQSEKPRKCILVFGAHADDVDEIAGGTFAKYIAIGGEKLDHEGSALELQPP